MVAAQGPDLDAEIDPEDQARFDEILAPVMKIYNFVRYVATAVAAIFLAFAGYTLMTAGSDIRKRDQAKSMVGYVLLGMVVIWGTPAMISLLT